MRWIGMSLSAFLCLAGLASTSLSATLRYEGAVSGKGRPRLKLEVVMEEPKPGPPLSKLAEVVTIYVGEGSPAPACSWQIDYAAGPVRVRVTDLETGEVAEGSAP